VGTLTGQGGKELDQLHGVTVPIKVSGSFDNPKYALDTESLLKEAAQGKIEEKKEEIKQKATEQLQEKLQDGLKGLFR
jgi:AsmA protein